MSIKLTLELAGFIAGLRASAVPAEAHAMAGRCFADCVGCMIAGRYEEPTEIVRRSFLPAPGEVTLYFSRSGAAPGDAVLINGTAAHALDYDDSGVGLRGHPSTVLVPAILAQGEILGASGREMTAAYVVGYEVWAELAARDRGHHHLKGWHPTGIYGGIAAAAACAFMLGLSQTSAAHALGLAASQSAGLMVNFGTMTKPYHAGRAAHAGFTSAQLAANGMTASTIALEHPRGFLAAFSPEGEIDLEQPSRLGQSWRILERGINVKKYPTCYGTHRPLDAMLDLINATGIAPQNVASVTARIGRRTAEVLHSHRPRTALEAKFSLEFAMAGALVAREMGMAQLTDGFVRRQDVQALIEKVAADVDERHDPPTNAVVIRTLAGDELRSEEVAFARGAAPIPLTTDELWLKFASCAAAGQYDGSGRALFDALIGLEQLAHIKELPGLLSHATSPAQ